MVTYSPYTRKPVGGTSAAAQKFYSKSSGGSSSSGDVVVGTDVTRRADGSQVIIKRYSSGRTETTIKAPVAPKTRTQEERERILRTRFQKETTQSFRGEQSVNVRHVPKHPIKTLERERVPNEMTRSEFLIGSDAFQGVSTSEGVKAERVQSFQAGEFGGKRNPLGKRMVRETELKYTSEQREAQGADFKQQRLLQLSGRGGREKVSIESYPVLREASQVERVPLAFNTSIYSKEGQKQRFGNVGKIAEAAFTSEGKAYSGGDGTYLVGANVESAGMKRFLEAGSNRPVGTAFKYAILKAPLLATKGVIGAVAGGAKAYAGASVYFETTAVGLTEAGTKGQRTPREQEIIRRMGGESAFQKGTVIPAQKQEDIGIKTRGLGSQLLAEIPGSLAFGAGAPAYYQSSVVQSARKEGLTPEQTSSLQMVAERERRVSSVAEVPSIVAASKAVEGVGREAFSRMDKSMVVTAGKFSWQAAKTGFAKIAPLGAGEGLAGERGKEYTRGVMPSGTQQVIATAGAGIGAGSLGGALTGSTGKPLMRRGVQAFIDITDPSESVGDMFQDVGSFFSKRLGGKVWSPSMTVQRPAPSTATQSVSGQTPDQPRRNIWTISFGDARSTTPIPPFAPSTAVGSPIGVPVIPPNSNIPVGTPVGTPVGVPPTIPTTPTTPTTPTGTPVTTTVFTPITTPQSFLFPLKPKGGGSGKRKGKGKRGKGQKFGYSPSFFVAQSNLLSGRKTKRKGKKKKGVFSGLEVRGF